MKTRLAIIIGVSQMWAMTIVMAYTFFVAMTHGGETTVCINVYNEMWAEAILIPILLGFGLWVVIRMFIDLYRISRT